jgi:hypothetical protein
MKCKVFDDNVCPGAGINVRALNLLQQHASQIVLFGSGAAGLQTPDSDVDLLCVGENPKKIRSAKLDLIWISDEETRKEEWLGSELANHIARFGIWLHGGDTWSKGVYISENALQQKRRALRIRIKALRRSWPILTEEFRRHHTTLLRRDVQRYRLLDEGSPVPPTPFLDEEWRNAVCSAFDESEWLKSGSDPISDWKSWHFESSCMNLSNKRALALHVVTRTGDRTI